MKPREITNLAVQAVLVIMGLVGLLALLVAFGPIFVFVAIAVFVMTYHKHLVARQYAFLWVITVASERLIPLVPAIRAYAGERGGAFAWRAHRVADMLTAGVPLPEALHRSPGLVPRDALPTILVGFESGALAPALRQVVTRRGLDLSGWQGLMAKIVYLCFLITFFLAIMSFVLLRIAPEFQKIFGEFEIELPAMTQAVNNVAYMVSMFWIFVPLLLIAAIVLFFYTLLRYSGWITWNPPGVDRLLRRLDTAVILDALSLAARREQPLGRAVAALARSYHKRSIRRRLHEVRLDIDRGADWCESLLRHGLIARADAAVLQSAARVGNLPWALREMADSSRRRLAYRMQALVHVLYPPLILTFGFVVMVFVVSYFLPLITLIQSLN